MSSIDLNIAEDFLAQVDLEQPATTTGIWAAATGLSSVSFRIALTRTGSAVGSLTGSATERSATAGRYYAVFDAATLTTDLAAYVGSAQAAVTISGTSALHIALLVAGVLPDDEVLLPALSFVAPANAIRYCSAWPTFIDVSLHTWQWDSNAVEDFLRHHCQLLMNLRQPPKF